MQFEILEHNKNPYLSHEYRHVAIGGVHRTKTWENGHYSHPNHSDTTDRLFDGEDP